MHTALTMLMVAWPSAWIAMILTFNAENKRTTAKSVETNNFSSVLFLDKRFCCNLFIQAFCFCNEQAIVLM